MNLPISTNFNTNQIKNNILGYTNVLSDEKKQWIEKIKENFKTNLNYFPVAKNLDLTKIYDALIYDGNRNEKVLGSKQFLSYPYDTVTFDIGDYVSFQYGDEYENWLITSLDKAQLYNVNGNVERCVANLKWIDKNGVLKNYPCVIKDSDQRIMMPDFNKLIITQKGYMKITVQENVDTDLLKINNRFLFGVPNNYTAFKIDLVNNYTKTKSLTFDMYVTELASEDDLVNGIAANGNVITPVPSPTGKTNIISPIMDTILQGADNAQIFTVFAYNNGVVQTDTFTITASGVPSNYWTLTIVDGNTFKIFNNQMYTDSKLKIVCTNNVDSTTKEMDVLLGGEF